MKHRLAPRSEHHAWPLTRLVGLVAMFAVVAMACAPSTPPAPTAQPQAPAAKAAAPTAKAAAPAAKAEAPAAQPVNLPPIRISVGSRTTWTTHLTILVAMYEGFFKEAGLNSVTFTKSGNDGNSLAALVSGTEDIAVSITADTIAKLVAKGEPLFIIGSTSNKLPHIIFGKKGMTSAAQLKGAKIATDSQASSVDGYVEKGLAPHGLKLSDISLIRVGNSAERFQALDNGVVDAALIGPSEQPRAIAAGYPQVMDISALFEEYLQRTYVVRGKFLQDNPAAVDAFMLAVVRSHDWLHKPENFDRLWQNMKADNYELDEKFFKPSVEAQLHLMPRNALPSAKGLQIVLDEVKADVPGVTADKLLRLDSVQKAIQKTGVQPG